MKKIFIFFTALVLVFSFALTASAANSITNRLKGKLLLQVQDKGRIWYVDPVGLQKHEVTFSNALNLFQTLSLGITNADLIKIPADLDSIGSSQDSDGDGYTDRSELQSGFSPYIAGAGAGRFSMDNNLAKKLKGRLLLQVQDKGRIWYIDQNGKRWEVTWGNLMSLFRKLALGITDKDLAGVGNVETANLCKNINQMCRSYSQGVGGGDNCCSGLKCDGSGPDGTTGICKDIAAVSTWQTYKNSEYGFEFKYPADFEIKQDKTGWPKAVALLYQSNSQAYAAEVEIWNTADEFSQSIQHQGAQPNFIREHNGKYITLDYWEGNIDSQIFYQILSAFSARG